ncbi:MAG: hypothetical protein SFV23_16955 [Planctomycetaceae bacterium]|nr:hypothetical protein [Planctomycetaceae bacterium]
MRSLRAELEAWITKNSLWDDTWFETPDSGTDGPDLVLLSEGDLSTVIWCRPTDVRTASEAEALRAEFDQIVKQRKATFSFKNEIEMHLYFCDASR